jgi:hypothetical protein
VQLAEYAVASWLNKELVFAWWVPAILGHRNRNVSKIKSKYWTQTHKYGVLVPKSVKQALQLDAKEGTTMRWDAIAKEIVNVWPAFKV